MAAPLLSQNELRFLRALLHRRVRFMLVGLSAAALQGAPVVTQGVDLWFEDLSDPRIREALNDVDAAYVLTMHGLESFERELENCVEVALGRQKLKVLRLDRILASKQAANRPKDRLAIAVLSDAIATSKTANERNPSQKKKPRS